MGIFSRSKKIEKQPEERSYYTGILDFNSLSTYSTSQSMRLSAVYCAVNVISNSVAMLPINIKKTDGMYNRTVQHPLLSVLNLKPDNRLTHYTLFKQLMESVMLKGNGYAYIDRDDRLNVKAIKFIDPDFVTVMPQEDGTIKYLVTGMQAAIPAENMIDLAMHRDEMYRGISVIKYADMCLRGAKDAENQAGAFFKSGGNLSGVIVPSAPINNEQKKQIAETWKQSFMQGEPNKVSVAVLPYGVQYQSIARVSPADGELLESRQYSVIEIARFFNIPPSKLMVMTEVSYNSLEMYEIMYMQDCIMPYCKMIEDEFNLKLFKPSELGKMKVDFDLDALLKANKEAEGNYYRTLVTNGILSIDDVRNRLGFEPLKTEASQAHYLQTSYSTIDLIQSGAFIKSQSQTQDQNKGVDNKAKQKED